MRPDPGQPPLRIGLVINPVAGLGGATALAGSDGAATQERARALGGAARGLARAQRLLGACAAGLEAAGLPLAQLQWFTWHGSMGSDAFNEQNAAQDASSGDQPFSATIVGAPAGTETRAADTRSAASALRATGVDLLVFVGGDGTARDVVAAELGGQLVLGVPAGVKMHSGVFATTPEAAATIVLGLARGALVAATVGEVRDLDEAARRQGDLRTRRFGELNIPAAGGYVQRTKEAGRENEALAVEEIVAEVVESASGLVVLGPGSTCARIKAELGITPTLLGVDVWHDGQCVGRNVDARWLAAHAPAPTALIVSFIRGQGFLFGRGNQQLSAQWLQQIDRACIQIVATRTKLLTLEGGPLLIDTDLASTNEQLCGLFAITVGYQDQLWYRAATHGAGPPELAS